MTGRGYCGATDGVRFYVCGHRCPAHTPNALAGLPEDRPDPATGLDALRARARARVQEATERKDTP